MLGLCFVGVVLGGFLVAYIVADQVLRRQAARAQTANLQAVSRTLADALVELDGEADAAAVKALVESFGRLPQVGSVAWLDAAGQPLAAWPPTLSGLVGAAAEGAPGSGRRAGRSRPVVSVSVGGTGEKGAGVVRIRAARDARAGFQSGLAWNWGISAAVTLAAFAGVYARLRRHLKPVAAIERSLRSYEDGLEKELVTLTLSDSLGTVARGWNRLIEQLTELRQQTEHGQLASGVEDVLARYESAVFRSVVDRLPHGVICLSDQHTISYANAAAAGLLGHPVDDLVGKALGGVIDNASVVQAVAGVEARSGGRLTVDHTAKVGEQETTLRFRVLNLRDKGAGGGALITVEDISQLREGERARDNFLYHVTHELRTPLTNIHAYTETLTKPGFDDEQTRKECYNVIISETRRLSRLVEDILSISQLEVGTARMESGEVDLVRLVRQMVQDNLGAADEKRIDLRLSLPPKVPKISGDKQRLSVLLNNLIGNAVKYTSEGGKVSVQVTVEERQISIAVSDTGIGISPEDQKNVFEKFYRAAADPVQMVTGTGLGLALAREVARLHGGDIRLESELGKGSVFTVELPLPAAQHAEVAG
jgi:signal transduction histidine kinase